MRNSSQCRRQQDNFERFGRERQGGRVGAKELCRSARLLARHLCCRPDLWLLHVNSHHGTGLRRIPKCQPPVASAHFEDMRIAKINRLENCTRLNASRIHLNCHLIAMIQHRPAGRWNAQPIQSAVLKGACVVDSRYIVRGSEEPRANRKLGRAVKLTYNALIRGSATGRPDSVFPSPCRLPLRISSTSALVIMRLLTMCKRS